VRSVRNRDRNVNGPRMHVGNITWMLSAFDQFDGELHLGSVASPIPAVALCRSPETDDRSEMLIAVTWSRMWALDTFLSLGEITLPPVSFRDTIECVHANPWYCKSDRAVRSIRRHDRVRCVVDAVCGIVDCVPLVESSSRVYGVAAIHISARQKMGCAHATAPGLCLETVKRHRTFRC
jgi:hypothetical protein